MKSREISILQFSVAYYRLNLCSFSPRRLKKRLECYISRLLICTKMKFFVKKTAYSITVINVQTWNSTWRIQLTQSRSQLCLQIFGFSVRHTYIFGDFNQIKQFNTRSLMNSDNSYFGFRIVQVYLCLCDGSSAI